MKKVGRKSCPLEKKVAERGELLRSMFSTVHFDSGKLRDLDNGFASSVCSCTLIPQLQIFVVLLSTIYQACCYVFSPIGMIWMSLRKKHPIVTNI